MHFRTRFVYFKSCRYNLCIIKTHSPLLLRECSYNLCIFARDLSILRVVDINLCIFVRHFVHVIYAFSRDTYPYYYGDVAIIYSFLHQICLFYELSMLFMHYKDTLTLITTEVQLKVKKQFENETIARLVCTTIIPYHDVNLQREISDMLDNL